MSQVNRTCSQCNGWTFPSVSMWFYASPFEKFINDTKMTKQDVDNLKKSIKDYYHTCDNERCINAALDKGKCRTKMCYTSSVREGVYCNKCFWEHKDNVASLSLGFEFI